MRGTVTLLAVLLALPGCPYQSSSRPVGERCSQDSDCAELLVCRYGRCLVECHFDRECDPGDVCIPAEGLDDGGVCWTAELATSEECPGETVRDEGGLCREACGSSEGCGPGRVCVDDFCEDSSSSDGDADADADVDADVDADADHDAELLRGGIHLGENMDFEADSTEWTGDSHALVGVDQGITPVSGLEMMRAIDTGGGINFDLYQEIDLTPHREAIARGDAEMRLEVRANRISGDATFPSAMFFNAIVLDATAAEVGVFGPSPTTATEVYTDDDPITWELAYVEFVVPPSATTVRVRLAWAEIIDRASSEFPGNYFDDVRLVLIDPSP